LCIKLVIYPESYQDARSAKHKIILNQVLVDRKWKTKYADELSGDKRFTNLGEESKRHFMRGYVDPS